MKNNRGNKIKNIVFGVFIASLFVPIFQKQFNLLKERPFKSFFHTEPFPLFSMDFFERGAFQEKFEKALIDNVGFRISFIRIQNQINYSLYNISKEPFVIIGKNNYLFGESYVNGYTGGDFIGKESIELQIEKAKAVEQELKKRNIAMIFAFAPGKGSFFPEYIPERYLNKNPIDSTNYVCFINACNKAKFNVIDLRKYLISIKSTAKQPIFSQVGVHWSDYAAFLAIDTIAKKIAEIKKLTLPKIKINKFEFLDTITDQDRDIEYMMAIFADLPRYNMAHLKIDFLNDPTYDRPNVLTISDSYFGTILRTNVVDSLFSEWGYWYYNNHAIANKPESPFDLRSEIEKRDVILLMATDATLGSFPYGFIDEAYELYAPKDKGYYTLKNKEFRLFVYQTFVNIKKNKTWRNQLLRTAKEKGISETEQFFDAAVWCYNEKYKK